MKGFLKFFLGVVMLLGSLFGFYCVIFGDFSGSTYGGTIRIIIGVVSFVVFLGAIYILRR
jgi:hypothetical protein